jgi:hypothetical protein
VCEQGQGSAAFGGADIRRDLADVAMNENLISVVAQHEPHTVAVETSWLDIPAQMTLNRLGTMQIHLRHG